MTVARFYRVFTELSTRLMKSKQWEPLALEVRHGIRPGVTEFF